MRVPAQALVARVKSGQLDTRTKRELLRYRPWFNAYNDKNELVTDDHLEEIVRVVLSPRAVRRFGK